MAVPAEAVLPVKRDRLTERLPDPPEPIAPPEAPPPGAWLFVKLVPVIEYVFSGRFGTKIAIAPPATLPETEAVLLLKVEF